MIILYLFQETGREGAFKEIKKKKKEKSGEATQTFTLKNLEAE